MIQVPFSWNEWLLVLGFRVRLLERATNTITTDIPPRPLIPKDSSAAAIASSALLDLYRITGNEEYRRSAYNILKSLSSRNYLSTDLIDYQGIIMHGCYDKNNGAYVDSSLIYGDYFYLESLGKLS